MKFGLRAKVEREIVASKKLQRLEDSLKDLETRTKKIEQDIIQAKKDIEELKKSNP